MTAAMLKYADGYLSIVHDFTPTDGSLAEQYFRDDGSPLSAAALTWSYSSFLTATSRRSSVVPNSWGASKAGAPPAICSSTSAPGSYAPAPVDCSSNVSSVTITFDVLKPTMFGETVFVTENLPPLPLRFCSYVDMHPFNLVQVASYTRPHMLLHLAKTGSLMRATGQGPLQRWRRVTRSNTSITKRAPMARRWCMKVGPTDALPYLKVVREMLFRSIHGRNRE
ncbi:MAG: hypothetical protein Q9198_004638 [Flavoplaca austrocitrina]